MAHVQGIEPHETSLLMRLVFRKVRQLLWVEDIVIGERVEDLPEALGRRGWASGPRRA